MSGVGEAVGVCKSPGSSSCGGGSVCHVPQRNYIRLRHTPRSARLRVATAALATLPSVSPPPPPTPCMRPRAPLHRQHIARVAREGSPLLSSQTTKPPPGGCQSSWRSRQAAHGHRLSHAS